MIQNTDCTPIAGTPMQNLSIPSGQSRSARADRRAPSISQIEKEILLLKKQIAVLNAEYSTYQRQHPFRLVSGALMHLSNLRAEIRKQELLKQGIIGWQCGTHARQTRSCLEMRLRQKYSEDDLMQMILYCAHPSTPSPEAERRSMRILCELWFLIPKPHLNRHAMFDDE